jgi:hypothetical protein
MREIYSGSKAFGMEGLGLGLGLDLGMDNIALMMGGREEGRKGGFPL